MLPLVLEPTAHLLFTFYKVHVKKKQGKTELVGQAVLPLFTNGRLLDTSQPLQLVTDS